MRGSHQPYHQLMGTVSALKGPSHTDLNQHPMQLARSAFLCYSLFLEHLPVCPETFYVPGDSPSEPGCLPHVPAVCSVLGPELSPGPYHIIPSLLSGVSLRAQSCLPPHSLGHRLPDNSNRINLMNERQPSFYQMLDMQGEMLTIFRKIKDIQDWLIKTKQ